MDTENVVIFRACDAAIAKVVSDSTIPGWSVISNLKISKTDQNHHMKGTV